jgi:hypothetical protein
MSFAQHSVLRTARSLRDFSGIVLNFSNFLFPALFSPAAGTRANYAGEGREPLGAKSKSILERVTK